MPGSVEMTVSELNLAVAEALRKDPRLRVLSVRGEISGFKHHIASGHWYFSLKDENASVNCVMFRQNTLKCKSRPKDGDSVIIDGYVDVFPRNGTYQLYAMVMRSAGTGDLHLRFEALKNKLNAEGLFDLQRKKRLPMMPKKVAVVTSRSGAAIHDILNVSGKRCPGIPIVLIPVAVQGPGAAEEIAEGIRKANRFTDADVLIVGRGGGSAEDLWCFNEEAVARAVAESRIPVVSGVGHEVDVSICDLAADVRAATPSNAAELVFPERSELRERIRVIRLGLTRAVSEQIHRRERRSRDLRSCLTLLSPEKRIAHLTGAAALSREKLNRAIGKQTEVFAKALQEDRLALETGIRKRTEESRARLTLLLERLKAMNPMDVLNRGYTLVYSETGQLVKTAAEAEEQERLQIRFADGRVRVSRREQKDGDTRKNL